MPLRRADWWKTGFPSQLGQFEWKVTPFGLQGGPPDRPPARPPQACWSGPLHRSAPVYMDDLLCYSLSLARRPGGRCLSSEL